MAGEREQPPGGLSGQEAAKLQQLGRPRIPTAARSRASSPATCSLFNAIIGVFFIFILALGLFADALFGFIAIINSYIGIRQELKAKETLESLALLVAPRAKAIRDGAVVEVPADEVVPGDFVRVEPGDQLVADGGVVESRGLTVDESMLTGEADGVQRSGQRVLRARSRSRARATTRSTPSARTATRPRSPARPAGSAIPLALQEEVNQVLKACTWLLIPLAAILILALVARNTPLDEAAQTATAGLITLIPEGLVLLMSVTLAVAAVRLARLNTLVQQDGGDGVAGAGHHLRGPAPSPPAS